MDNREDHPARAYYFERNGRFYRQWDTYSKKYGYYIPQSPHRISRAEYEKNIKNTEKKEC